MASTKKWYTSKTLWASIVTIVTGIGMLATGEQDLQEVLIVIIGAVFAYLRTITNIKLTR